MKVRGKIIAVTGGGSGIGQALVLELLNRGAKVAAIDLNEKGLKETQALASQYGNHLSLHHANITDIHRVNQLPDEILQQHQALDGLINNAGIIHPFIKVLDLKLEKIQQIFDVNFYGTLYMIRSFAPYLLKRDEAHILNISSMGGFLPVPGQTIYGSSKAAVKLLTEGLYSEFNETSIKVTVVFPGGVKTNISNELGLDPKKVEELSKGRKVMLPEEAATIILNGMEKDKYRVLVGSDAKMMDFLYRRFPRFANHLITKQMKNLLP